MKCARLILGTLLLEALALSQASQTGNWANLQRDAEQSYVKGDLKEAIRSARLATDVASGARESGQSLDRLGFFEYTQGDVKEGEAHLRQALTLREDAFGNQSAEYAESANDLALLLRDSGRLAEAADRANQAVAIRSRVLGARDLGVAESLNTLGSIYALLGEYENGIKRLEEARAIHEAQPEPREFSEEYGTLCVNLAGTYHRIGKYANAEAMFERGLEVLRVRPGINHPAYSASLVAYAYLQADLAHYSKAEKLYDEASRLVPQQLGEQHAVYAALLNNRGALYKAIGNLPQAEADYRKSLEIKRKIFAPDALTIGASLRNLAALVNTRNPAEGQELFQEAVSIYSKNPKPPPFDFASALRGLAEAQKTRNDLNAARMTLGRALDVARDGLGLRHPLRSALLGDLAAIHASAGEYGEAIQELQQALAVITESQGENHPDLAPYLRQLADVYTATGDYQAAEPLYRRGVELTDAILTDILSIGSQSSKSLVLANLDDPVPALLEFQKKTGDRFTAARTLAFEAVANRKGRALDQVHDWGQTLRQSSDAQVRAGFQEWEAMLECEASLAITLGYRENRPAVVGSCALAGTDLAGRYERLLHELRTNWTEVLGKQGFAAVNVLRRRIEAREADLSRAIPHFSPAAKFARLEDIRTGLEHDEALIEFTEFELKGSSKGQPGGKQSYGAYLLASDGVLAWVDLGAAAPLDRSIQDLIAAANDWSESAVKNERRATDTSAATAQGALRSLSAKLRPVVDWLAGHRELRRVRVSPDGLLHLIPFSAVVDARGHPLIEKFAISYLGGGRELATPLKLLDPDGQLIVAVSPGPATPPSAGAPVASAFRTGILNRLPNAATEAQAIRKRMPKAILLGEGEATEQRLKRLQHPALLHIIGHGVVRGNEDCLVSVGCQLADMDSGSRAMSLSAIVLEENYGRGGRSDQDGLLTALELQALDLQGSEMLVLSQCRMADGVPSLGDGVFGMRRAAAIAGVRTFIAPLWNVSDVAQEALMAAFYRELASGKQRAEALRQAQLETRANPKTSSFLFWGPIILSGDPMAVPPAWFAR